MGGLGCKLCVDDKSSESIELEASPRPATDDAVAGVQEFLASVKLLQTLPDADKPLLAQACERTNFEGGSTLCQQGEDGDAFFVIVSGTVRVEVDGTQVATLKGGDFFGEHALLFDEPRNASIVAEETVSTLKITRNRFRELGLNEKLQFPKREAVAGGGENLAKPPSPKTAEERQLMDTALKGNFALSTLFAMTDDVRNQIIDACWKEKVTANTTVITQGDMVANYFYIIGTGQLQVIKDGKAVVKKNCSAESGVQDFTRRTLIMSGNAQIAVDTGVLKPGSSFGELALLYTAPRAATIKAIEDSTVWVIDRVTAKTILGKSGDLALQTYVKYLEKVEVLGKLLPEEKTEVAKHLRERYFSANETVFEQGQEGDSFYILYEGEVAVIQDGKEVNKLTGVLQDGKAPIFGEKALIKNEPRNATIKITSNSAKLLSMDKVSFEMVLGKSLAAIEEEASKGARAPETEAGLKRQASKILVQRSSVKPVEEREHILRSDLKVLGVLGCGGFGFVEMVQHKVTQECYALKAVSKGYVAMQAFLKKQIIAEKEIHYSCNSTFVVKLHDTYNTDELFYFLIEPCIGGELYASMHKKGLCGNVKYGKYYAAGAICALEHVHGLKVIYRDLKAENLLLNEKGHVKLTDFGLSKVSPGKTFTTCGTPEYFSPEMVASKGHTFATDWWTVGVLLFEIVNGRGPFADFDGPQAIFARIQKGVSKVSFPGKLKGAGKELITALLDADPEQRLPMRKGGVDNIKQHAFYKASGKNEKDFDWAAFEGGTMIAPYVPKTKSKTDLKNFNHPAEKKPPQFPYDGKGDWDKDFATST